MAHSNLQPNGDTINATESISNAQKKTKKKKKNQNKGVSRHEVGKM